MLFATNKTRLSPYPHTASDVTNGMIIPLQRVDKLIDTLADQEKGRDILPK